MINDRDSIGLRLARFGAELELSDVPDVVVDRAKACLTYGLSVGIAGLATPYGAMAEAAVSLGETGSSRILTSRRTVSAAAAAFINSSLIQAQTQDDTHGTTHLGTSVIPVAVALADETRASGESFLTAVIAGYEVGACLATQLTESTTPPFRASIYGFIGAAVTAARLLSLDPIQTASALAIASAFAGGTINSIGKGTDEWHFQYALAAQSGVTAAKLARAGARGYERAFESNDGFIAAFTKSVGVNDGGIGRSLGAEWELCNVLSKPYPICAFNQAPALVAARLATAHDLRVSDVSSVSMELNAEEAAYPGMKNAGPFSDVGETLASAPFCVALALSDREITWGGLQRFDDQAILSVANVSAVIGEQNRAPKTAHLSIRTREGMEWHDELLDPRSEFAWSFDRACGESRRLLEDANYPPDQIDSFLDDAANIEDAEPADLMRALVLGKAVRNRVEDAGIQ